MVAADDAVPAELITLILLTNWCYTKMAKRKNNICTLYGLTVYKKKLSKLVDKCRRYSKPMQTQ